METKERFRYTASILTRRSGDFQSYVSNITQRNDNIYQISPGIRSIDDGKEYTIYTLYITEEEASLLVLQTGCNIKVISKVKGFR